MRTREKRVAITDKERAKNEQRERIRRVYYEMDGRMNERVSLLHSAFSLKPLLQNTIKLTV